MKYFDILPELVGEELKKRGVPLDQLLYCVKADLDGKGEYYDVYVTFTKDNLYVISGYEEYPDLKKRSQLAMGAKKGLLEERL